MPRLRRAGVPEVEGDDQVAERGEAPGVGNPLAQVAVALVGQHDGRRAAAEPVSHKPGPVRGAEVEVARGRRAAVGGASRPGPESQRRAQGDHGQKRRKPHVSLRPRRGAGG